MKCNVSKFSVCGFEIERYDYLQKMFFFHLCAILLGLNGIEPKALGDIDTDVCVRFTCNFFHTNIICFRTCGIVLKPSLKVIFQILPTLFLQSS